MCGNLAGGGWGVEGATLFLGVCIYIRWWGQVFCDVVVEWRIVFVVFSSINLLCDLYGKPFYKILLAGVRGMFGWAGLF